MRSMLAMADEEIRYRSMAEGQLQHNKVAS